MTVLAGGVVFGRIPVSGADRWPEAAISFVLFVICVVFVANVVVVKEGPCGWNDKMQHSGSLKLGEIKSYSCLFWEIYAIVMGVSELFLALRLT